MTKLANDVMRCRGQNAAGPCLIRHNCLRYLDRLGGGEWTEATNHLCAEQGQDAQIPLTGASSND